MCWEIITFVLGVLKAIGNLIEGILGVIVGSVITIFYGSYNNFKKRIKKHISLKKDIDQLIPYPPINLIFCPEEMYNNILHLLKCYYFFSENVDSLDVDIDILILMKDLTFHMKKSFMYFSHSKYPLRYRINHTHINNGEIKLNEEDTEYTGFKKGKLTIYYKNTFLNQCTDINKMIDSNLIEAMQKMNDINACLNKYEKFNEQNSLISFLKSQISKKCENNKSTQEMEKHLNKNPFRNYISTYGYEIFFMYLNFCPDIGYCEIKNKIIFMQTDSSYNLEEVARDVHFYILDLKDILGYQKEKLLTPKVYYYQDNTLEEYNIAKGNLNIIITNLIDVEFDSIDTSII